MNRRTVLVSLGFLALALLVWQHERLARLLTAGEARRGAGWTLDEAVAQWRLAPRDPYLQYVVLQLARRQGNMESMAQEVEQELGREAGPGRGTQVDLFSLFTGALAVQESLQLDTMRGGPSRARPARPLMMTAKMPARMMTAKTGPVEPPPKPPDVDVAALHGPTIKSHPWEQMLSGRRPEISSLARQVPEDFYWIEFHSLTKLLEAMDLSDLWGTHFLDQASHEARTSRTGQRVKEHLAVETSRLLRPFYDLAVAEVGVTGSDLFLREGSDLTLLFRLRQPEVFRARMNGFLDNAERAHPNARRTTGTIRGVEYVHLETPERELNVYSAYPAPDLHVRSNSKVAFERVLEAVRGRTADERPVRRLGETAEFAFIRTLMPQGAPEEDGFIYLSDPFIRRLVGPEVKLTERRRMLCYNHLRMISHAALLYQTEQSRPARSLEELARADCCPGRFNEGTLRCPDGGTYTLSANGTAGVCSHHGHARLLTPCCEIPVTRVSAAEADEYRAFLEEYNQYWRTYFDPIALRLQLTPRQYRLETIVLPLIDNSVYTGMAHVFGGKPETLDALPVPRGNIFSVAVRVNKEELLREAGIPDEAGTAELPEGYRQGDLVCSNNLRQIGIALHNYHDAYGTFPPVGLPAPGGGRDPAKKPLLSWRVHLLPFLEQDVLYRGFHLDEPWDSEHNKALLSRIPAVYRCPSVRGADAGKTTYQVPVGKGNVFTGGPEGTRLTEIMDGTSQTILLVDADREHAVPWTKPDDLLIDPKQPAAGLGRQHGGIFLMLFADGSLHFLRSTIDADTLRGLYTRAGNEVLDLTRKEIPVRSGGAREFFDLPGVGPQEMARFRDFLYRGVGRQVGFHIYDATPLVDFNFPRFLGMLGGTFNGRWNGRMEEWWVSFLIASLNAPVYVSASVQDEKVVDRFLETVDQLVADRVKEQVRHSGLWGLELDYYRMEPGQKGEPATRTLGVRFGPLRWRVFWARVGRGLYVASKPFILDDLRDARGARANNPHGQGPEAHAMVRVRPEHWHDVLADFRLGWAENNREACLANLAPLSGVARALASDRPAADRAARAQTLAERLYTVHFFCPEGGSYRLAPDGKSVECSLHGTVQAPRQRAAPAAGTALAKLVESFGGLTASLTFREDGLHAVVVIERK